MSASSKIQVIPLPTTEKTEHTKLYIIAQTSRPIKYYMISTRTFPFSSASWGICIDSPLINHLSFWLDLLLLCVGISILSFTSSIMNDFFLVSSSSTFSDQCKWSFLWHHLMRLALCPVNMNTTSVHFFSFHLLCCCALIHILSGGKVNGILSSSYLSSHKMHNARSFTLTALFARDLFCKLNYNLPRLL